MRQEARDFQLIGETVLGEAWFAALLLIISTIGLIWAIIRERHLVDLSKEQTHTNKDFERTFQSGAEAVKASFGVVNESLRSLERQIERSEDLSETRRQEMIRLIVDVERRMMEAMRDITRDRASTNVNFNGGANGTQIGDGNKQL